MKYNLIITAVIAYITLCYLGIYLDFLKDQKIRETAHQYFKEGRELGQWECKNND